MTSDGAHRETLFEALDERSPSLTGLATNAVILARARALAQFEADGLPDSALPQAIEALQTERHAYLVAAGAKALRGSRAPAAWMLPVVERALEAVRQNDDTVSLEPRDDAWPSANATTASGELLATRDWLRRRIGEISDDGCCIPAVLGQSRPRFDSTSIDQVVAEDQDGRRLLLAEALQGTASVVAFFYTRCMNPAKCSMTVTRLGHLQRALSREGIDARLLGVTYDPAYDTPNRLKAYATSRGFETTERSHMIRVISGMEGLSKAFALGVNYGDVTVNHHRIELFVLDPKGRVTLAFTRLEWSVDAVVAAVRHAARPSFVSRLRHATRAAATPAALVAAFVPHCPFCWSAYATAAGVPSLAVASPAWLHRGAWLLLGINTIAAVIAVCRSRVSALSGALMLAGTSLLAVVATVPPFGSSRSLACVLLAGGVVLGLRQARATARPRPVRA